MRQLTLDDVKNYELVVDNFAGGGGASVGIEMAINRPIDYAINHDPKAIAMHMANHPYTRHYCESVWEVDPVEVTRGKPVGLAWFSPDCKHFSKAKGGKPKNKKIRGLAWVAVKWASFVKPRVIMLENVEEFKTWGPLDEDGKVIKERKGETFNHFINALEENGYQVDYRELRACDYGAPTTRKRFFLIARCDGRQIIWPQPTHGDPNSIEVKQGKLKPWKTAAQIIDWTIPCPSIFETSENIKKKYGLIVKRPLSENTLKRIARGIKKFVIDNPKPFILHNQFNNTGSSLKKPLNTILTGNHHYLVTPFITTYHTETRENEIRGQELGKPITTVDASNRYAIATAFIERTFTSSTGHKMDLPLGTLTTVNKTRLVEAFLIKYYGSDVGQDLNGPLHTVTSKDRFGLVTIANEQYKIVDIGLRMLQARELFNAHAFPEDYIIDRDYQGNRYPKTAQVARVGNSVPPPFAKALVLENLPELIEVDNKQAI